MTKAGHNSVDKSILLSFVTRCETLIEERRGVNDDIKLVLGEAKEQGYDVKTIRAVIRERAKDEEKRDAERVLMDAYLAALGLL